MKEGFCKDDQIGQFILSTNSSESRNPIVSQTVHVKDPGEPLRYEIKRTGYYCVGTYGYTASEYKAVVEFRNAYGELPAAQIAKLPFYGGLTIVYAVIGMYVPQKPMREDIAKIKSVSGAFYMYKTAMTYVSLGSRKLGSLLIDRSSSCPELYHGNYNLPCC